VIARGQFQFSLNNELITSDNSPYQTLCERIKMSVEERVIHVDGDERKQYKLGAWVSDACYHEILDEAQVYGLSYELMVHRVLEAWADDRIQYRVEDDVEIDDSDRHG
tara:strand:+ start:107 stop:430 length:324 start_codon:yes stop_codon:yes gene_type:complete